MSGCIRHLSIWHSPVFLVNSYLDLFSAPPSLEDPLSRSYGVNLPSSLTMNLSSASVFSTRPPVSVCGTGPDVPLCRLADFLGSMLTAAIRSPVGSRYCPGSAHGACFTTPRLPTPVQRAIPSARGRVTSPSPRRWDAGGNGILTVCPSPAPYGSGLGPDLP